MVFKPSNVLKQKINSVLVNGHDEEPDGQTNDSDD
jgi:hypothetical protein